MPKKTMGSQNPSVAIILVNWNSFELTEKCLLTLDKISYDNSKIYLVDNGSHDNSGNLLNKRFPNITFIQNEDNLGFTGGNNIAIEKAVEDGNDFIMLLNNDTEVEPDFIEPLVDRLRSDASLAAVQPLILDLKEKSKIWNAGGDFNRIFGTTSTRLEGQPKTNLLELNPNTEWITGCCILVRTKVLLEIGSLNNKYFAYYEDVDWSIRMKKAGYQLGIEYKSIVYHLSMATLKSKEKKKDGYLSPFAHYLMVRNHIYLIRLHKGFFNIIGVWLYQLVKFIGYMLYFTLRWRLEKLRSAFRGFKHGLTK